MTSVKKMLLEFENANDEKFSFIDSDIIDRIIDVDFNSASNFISIKFNTTYNKKFTLYFPLNKFKEWLSKYIKNNSDNNFLSFLLDFFTNAKEQQEELTEIIDDSNEIMQNDDMPSNATNTMVGGADQTMDLEKVFKKSMPKSVRNYSGNLGLGTVVW